MRLRMLILCLQKLAAFEIPCFPHSRPLSHRRCVSAPRILLLGSPSHSLSPGAHGLQIRRANWCSSPSGIFSLPPAGYEAELPETKGLCPYTPLRESTSRLHAW